jgi:hypothetical protein
MDSSNLEPRDESTKSLQDYLSNNNYRNLIAFASIFMFSIVFYLIYLIVDSLIDKDQHYKLSLQAYEKYEKSAVLRKKKHQNKQHQQTVVDETGGGGGVGSARAEDSDSTSTSVVADKERNGQFSFTLWSNRNLQISFVHSTLCSLWLVRIIWLRAGQPGDLLLHVTWDTYLLVAFSCGYFLYDFYDIYVNGYFKQEWVVCVHHMIVLLTFSYHLTHLLSIGYTNLALMVIIIK